MMIRRLPQPPSAPLRESAVRSPRVIPEEGSEFFITGFMPLYNSSSSHSLSFAILKALLPFLERDDFRAVKIVRSGSGKGLIRDSADASSSFIVRLRTPQLAKSVVNVRKSYNHNYFSTRNLDLSILSPEVASSLPECQIFVNEVLSISDQRDYLSLKETAKRLGFKYVWHHAGKFLVRWREGQSAHAIETPADISAILASLQAKNMLQHHQRLPPPRVFWPHHWPYHPLQHNPQCMQIAIPPQPLHND